MKGGGHAAIAAVRPLFGEWLEIRHGVLTYRLTQVLTGHGCIRRDDTPGCHYAPGPDGSHGAGKPGGMGSRHLLRSSDASEGGGGARAGAVCYRHTSPPFISIIYADVIGGRSCNLNN